MKLTELAIDGYRNFRNLHLGKFSEGLNFVYGENGVGKTSLRKFLREVLFGSDDLSSSMFGGSVKPSFGHLNVRQGADEFRVQRDTQVNDHLRIRPTSTSLINDVGSLSQLTGNWNSEIYDTIFSFSFCETRENARCLVHVLQTQLGIERGAQAAGDEVAYQIWKRESAARETNLKLIQQRMESLNQEKTSCLREIENLENTRRIRLSELDRQIQAMAERLSGADLSFQRNELARIDREISELRELIGHSPEIQVAYTPTPVATEPHVHLYLRLDEIDNQIRCWRRVQSDIQAQRVRLKKDMEEWNELTLESTEHPYHHARAILLALESKVDQTDHFAGRWTEAEGQRMNPSEVMDSIRDLCHQMRDDLHGLCDELAQQYKHIRHKAVAAELKQLRRCYNEMGENTQSLVRRRDALIKEISQFDAPGAEAILRAEVAFYQSAQQEGYYAARQKLVSPALQHHASQNFHRVSQPELTEERRRLQSLELHRKSISDWIIAYESETGALKIRQAEWLRQRESLLSDRDAQRWYDQVANIEQELRKLESEHGLLLQRLEDDRGYVKPLANPILERAASLLIRITGGELGQVYLSDADESVELQIRDRIGRVLNFSALEKGKQDQVYFCLAIAAKESLATRNVEAPMVIDDAFVNIARDQVTPTLNLMEDLSRSGHQLLLLTQHRYLADRMPAAAVFELPPPVSFPLPYSSPDRSPGIPEGPLPNSNFQPTPFGSNFENELWSPPTPVLPDYPLSKYQSVESVSDYRDPVNFIVPHPTVAGHSASGRDFAGSRASNRNVSPVSVDQVADPLGYTIAVDDDTLLERIELLDFRQLRALADVKVDTVGCLLALDPMDLPVPFRESGISPDQVERWQSQAWLLSNVPGMRVNEARILVACGVTEPEHLATSHTQQLFERIQRFLLSPEGQRFARSVDSISLDRINGWYRALDATRARWDHGQGFSQRTRRRQRSSTTPRSYRPQDDNFLRDRSERSEASQKERNAGPFDVRTPRSLQASERGLSREPFVARTPRMSTPEGRRTVPPLAPVAAKTKSSNSKREPNIIGTKHRFYLDLEDHIEAAPSIGPKTAERFEKINVQTVADFLKQTAESMAAKLKYKRITAEVVRQWQQQDAARLSNP